MKKFLPKRHCKFCTEMYDPVSINFRNTDLLKQFIRQDGTIMPKRVCGSCRKHHVKVAREIKRARHLAMLPFVK